MPPQVAARLCITHLCDLACAGDCTAGSCDAQAGAPGKPWEPEESTSVSRRPLGILRGCAAT